jgi:hypothetical protein
MFDWIRKSTRIEERAEAAAKQMRYFRLFSQRGAFDQLGTSALRAGFNVVHEDALEARFQWAAHSHHPDFTFHVWFDERDAMSVIARSCPGDIFGLVMTCLANETNISVEKQASLEEHELGRHAIQFRDQMLTFKDFDDGIERYIRNTRRDPFFKRVAS